ncbi:MAG: PD-(D/E)XK nuclease family protein [Candidatus Micrarchaeia archaeon]|jgi:putative RecB family exonuclease
MQIYSHSRLSCFENCPLHFDYKYVSKVKPPKGKETAEQFTGKRVHEVLEKLYKDLRYSKEDGLDELLEYYKKIWTQGWNEEILIAKEGLEQKHFFTTGKKCIEDYYQEYKPFDQTRTIGLESRILVRLSDESDEYRLQGYIDRLAMDGSTYEIHDYKTGNHLKTQDEADSDRQLALYQIGIQQAWSDVKQVNLIWHYLNFNKEIRSERSKKQLDNLRKDTIALIDTVEAAKEKGRFPAKKSSLCDYCEYRELCPEWKHVLSVQLSLSNDYEKIPGVALVEEYAKLKAQEKEIADKIDMARVAVVKFAKAEGITVIQGKNNRLLVRTDLRTGFPTRSGGLTDYRKLEKILKDSGVWVEVSSISNELLSSALEEGKISGKLAEKISEFKKVSETTTVRVGKGV